MPSKKTTRAKGKTSSKSRTRRPAATFPCPNPGAPLSLNKIVDRMEADPAFARFIKGLLVDSYTDAAARACLVSYFNPSAADLTNLCIPEGCQEKIRFCTVIGPTTTTNLLIVGAAHRFSKKR